MEFFLILVLGAIVIWLMSKRSADHQHVQQLYDLVSNLEDRLVRLERTQELKAASPRPEPAPRVQYLGQPVDTTAKATPVNPVPAHIPAQPPQPVLRTEPPPTSAKTE